jgi:16S rRNA (guanine966-N2)-methyltransferase
VRGKRGGSRRLRIIAGAWRGRTLQFADHPAIRPTPDRVRETLFNWLQSTIRGACCLDLFAGSGALGLEALSRGAAQVDFVEQDRGSARAIQGHLQLLQAEGGQVQIRDAFRYLQQCDLSRYQLIFLDPPFGRGMLEQVVAVLQESTLHPDLQLYIELEKGGETIPLPDGWVVTRSGEAGQVRYLLAQRMAETAGGSDI